MLPSKKLFQIMLGIALLLAGCKQAPQEESFSSEVIPETVDFNFHIKPILSDRCFACHGPDDKSRKGDLRLDLEETAFAALGEEKDRFAIVPGKPEESHLYLRVIDSDPEVKMPPPESNLTLSEFEIALLKKWIEQEAEWKPHWAFISPEKRELPEIRKNDWPENEIDHFVLAKLEQHDLKPESSESKEKLLRRASFDITGLPPSVADVEGFQNNPSEDAYEQAVDKLLSSPHFGERMASIWLDAARYADSHGYQDDRPRTMWPWRDWVIEAFNDNLPYDEFITWQLAGDLLPDATYKQKLATGFNRNHGITQEGGVVNEEYVTEYVADRTNTVSTALLGLTMECARCHDHKYDPISQKDYYQMFAFFNTIDERGQINYFDQSPKPSMRVEDPKLEKTIAFLDSLTQNQETKISEYLPQAKTRFSQWIKTNEISSPSESDLKKGLIGYFKLDELVNKKTQNALMPERPATINTKLLTELNPPELVPGKSDQAMKFDGENYLNIGDVGDFEHWDRFSFGGWIQHTGEREKDAGLFVRRNGEQKRGGYELVLTAKNTLRASLIHNARDERIEVSTTAKVPAETWSHVFLTYDGSGKAAGISLFLNGVSIPITIEEDSLKRKSILNGNDFLVGNWTPRNKKRKEISGFADGAIDEVRVYDRMLSSVEVAALAGQELQDKSKMFSHFLSHYDQTWQHLNTKLDSLRALDLSIPHVMIMEEMEEPRPTHVLSRGAYDAPTERVFPTMPAQILAFDSTLFPTNRLGLAAWITDRKNPLTARVMVNRIWQMIFGKGLVGTPEDFGSQGALPSHPALLDWLAVDFMESGWDVKALIKKIVMSATYKQGAKISPEKLQKDPDNILLARGPGVRLSAEMMRDNALTMSGLLDARIGGKWVKPYQPDGIWKELANQIGENKYRTGKGTDLYRRSLYTYWKRTIPPPTMLTFDAAERTICVVKRQTTSTPLQSLVLLNDPQYIEASRVLALRMIREGGDSFEDRIRFGFKMTTSRSPNNEEVNILRSLWEQEMDRFKANTTKAEAYLNIGKFEIPELEDPATLAAYAVVANTLLNLDESKLKS